MPDMPTKVFHYTDQHGLLGIVKGKAFWCTHIGYLNDSSEYVYGLEIFEKALIEIAADQLRDSRTVGLATETINWLKRGLLDRGKNLEYLTSQCFVASFSAREDDLSQWRGYTQAGSRYALEIDSKALANLGKAAGMQFDCIRYSEHEMKSQMASLWLSEMDALINTLTKQGWDWNRPVSHIHPPEGYYNPIRKVALRLVVLAKSEQFSGEEEWRLWSHDSAPGTVDFRAGQSFLRPYATIEGIMSVVKAIWIGPTPHQELSLRSVEGLLDLAPENRTPV